MLSNRHSDYIFPIPFFSNSFNLIVTSFGTTRYLAQVNQGYFAAMIELQEGTNTIKATATTVVNVLDKDQMDTLLKGKWDGMKEALGSGDVDTAITAFESNSQETYRSEFMALKSVLKGISIMRQIKISA